MANSNLNSGWIYTRLIPNGTGLLSSQSSAVREANSGQRLSVELEQKRGKECP